MLGGERRHPLENAGLDLLVQWVHAPPLHAVTRSGRGGRIRTCECRYQKPDSAIRPTESRRKLRIPQHSGARFRVKRKPGRHSVHKLTLKQPPSRQEGQARTRPHAYDACLSSLRSRGCSSPFAVTPWKSPLGAVAQMVRRSQVTARAQCRAPAGAVGGTAFDRAPSRVPHP
jgi:hypothetical protein